MLVVVPTQAHVAAFLAARAGESRSRVALGRLAVTLGELVRAVVDAALPAVRRLDPLEERLLLRRVALEERRGGGRFAEVAARPGFVDALGATLGACRQAGVSAEALASCAAQTSGAVGRRLAAVAELIARFDALSDEVLAVDAGRAVILAAEALRRGEPLPELATESDGIVIRHVHELGPARVELLDALAARLAPQEVTIELPHRTEQTCWFAATARLLDRLEARGERMSLAVRPVDPLEGEGAGACAARVALGIDRSLPAGAVTVLHAPTPAAEHRALARAVRQMIDQGVPPERIAIAPRSLEAHAAPLADALGERGVPVHARRGSPAASAPPIRWIRDALDAAETGFSRRATGRLLGSTYAGEILGPLRLSGPAVVQMLRQIGVRVDATDSAGADEPVGAALDRLAAAGDGALARSVRTALDSLRSLVLPAAAARTVDEYVRAVRALTDDAGLRAILQRGARKRASDVLLGEHASSRQLDEISAMAVGRDEAALDVLDGALDALRSAARCTGLDGELPEGQLPGLLDDALAGANLPAGGTAGGAVRIVALRDAAGLDLDVLVVPGMREGELPAPAGIDPLLGPPERAAAARSLAARGPRWAWTFDVDGPDGSPAAEREPLLLALALPAARTRVLLTRSATDGQARPVPASPLLEDLLASARACGSDAPLDEHHLPIEPAPPLADAYGPEDVRRAALAGLASVPPGLSAERAAGEDLLARVSGDSPALDLRGLLEVVEIERGRLATMLAGQGAPGDRFSGYLGDDPASHTRLLARLRGTPERPLSTSQLETAARCPFQDFARRVLRIDAEGEAQDDVDPRGRGHLAHTCFEAAMRALIDSGIVPYRAALAADAEAIARDCARAAAAEWQARSALDPSLARVVAEQTVDQVAAMVRALYESDDQWTPIAVEHGFGGDAGWPALAVPDPAGGPAVHLLGRIDLVDRRGDALWVSDLKTGGKDGVEATLRPGELGKQSLQLPLYAAAARRSSEGVAEADARYLILREAQATPTVRERVAAGKAWREDGRTPDQVADVVDAAGRPTPLASRVHELVNRMRIGDHRALPAADACRICEYLSICRLPIGAPDREDS